MSGHRHGSLRLLLLLLLRRRWSVVTSRSLLAARVLELACLSAYHCVGWMIDAGSKAEVVLVRRNMAGLWFHMCRVDIRARLRTEA